MSAKDDGLTLDLPGEYNWGIDYGKGDFDVLYTEKEDPNFKVHMWVKEADVKVFQLLINRYKLGIYRGDEEYVTPIIIDTDKFYADFLESHKLLRLNLTFKEDLINKLETENEGLTIRCWAYAVEDGVETLVKEFKSYPISDINFSKINFTVSWEINL